MFPVQNRKSEKHQLILHTSISLGAKFHFNQKFRILRPNLSKKSILGWKRRKWTSPFISNFAQKWYFQSKIEKKNSTTELCTLELVKVLNFSLNGEYWFFEPNLSKKGISSQTQKKWASSLNSTYSN